LSFDDSGLCRDCAAERKIDVGARGGKTYLSQNIRNKEYTKRHIILISLQTQLLAHSKYTCISNVDTIQEGEDIHNNQHGQDMHIDLPQQRLLVDLAHVHFLVGSIVGSNVQARRLLYRLGVVLCGCHGGGSQ
jgi:hypothetical protein